MIILKHLTVERFRLLQEINLHFPQRGSILIQGPNEAGKSTLLESIYFALYGTPMTTDHGWSSIDDLVLYGSSQANVTLALSIGATELVINRVIERGKGQQVTLRIHKLSMPEEEIITGLGVANERIIAELGRMDGETLRNSCFIEQKSLSRLETLPGSERETTLRKLLGLEKLARLMDQFKLTPHDELMLNESAEYFKLAEVQARIPELSQKLGELEAALDAVTVSEELLEISQQEADIAEQKLSLEQLRERRSELKQRQSRIQQLKKADATLIEIIEAYDAMAEARRKLPELEREIAEHDRREHEELPALEKRAKELVDLTRSFGTLERLSNDLLIAVSTIKELEKDLKNYQDLKKENVELNTQIGDLNAQIEQTRQSLHEYEEQRRAGRPPLEARLVRLRRLNERLTALYKAEEKYTQRVMQQGLVEENTVQLARARKDVEKMEHELMLARPKALQAQQEADVLEKRSRQLSLSRHLEEWQSLKALSQGMAEAEKQVMDAHHRQERLTNTALETRRAASRWLIFSISGAALGVVLAIVALFLAFQQTIIASVIGLIALALFAGAAFSFYNYNRAHNKEQIANKDMQDAISQVGMTVAAREAVLRKSGNRDALAKVENEIRSLGGTVPRSREEAQQLLQQLQTKDESFDDIQRRLTTQHNVTQAAQKQVNITTEAVNALRQERQHLEDQRNKEGWNDFDAQLRSDRIAIQDQQNEIATLAGQEGLPIPSFDASVIEPSSTIAGVEMALADAIKATEQEILSLDGKLDIISDLASQLRTQQDSLDMLLRRQHALAERGGRYQGKNVEEQFENAREQQLTLRSALQTLQDSLRQRVKPLGVSFGQTAINNAEAAARKQLEALHIALGNRIELQSRFDNYTTLLKDRQDSLADHYNRLSRYSGALGSWIVPPNPFAETLTALRQRCQQEVIDANEKGTLQELEKLQQQESASRAKIDLCRQEIEEAHERITIMLIQRSRPQAKGYSFTDIVTVWPLVGEYTTLDRGRLEVECSSVEKELQELEQQELALSTKLQTGGKKLDLEQARTRMEQQDRSYQSKKHGSRLLKATSERLMRKMLPRTEYYIQQILPLLTSGRYHDIRLRTAEETGSSSGHFQLRVWDTTAGEYVPRTALSGGAADQLSLALRLAFAIAALPRELEAAPVFVLLDEPLSSFDSGRTRALVNVITGEVLSQHFEQVLFVSHSGAFDPAMFPYHIYMDNGLVVDSNLPVVTTTDVPATNGSESEVEKESEHKVEEKETKETKETTKPEPASVAVEM
ncbi:MAG TPA: AAA family ATPase [Ktedonobacteraceae bacterium]|nr:AAA family ATPase [Ktedonobacteraceae bacterium]